MTLAEVVGPEIAGVTSAFSVEAALHRLLGSLRSIRYESSASRQVVR